MDFGAMLNDSFYYAKDGIWGKWKRWLLLLISMIIFPFILGYMVRVYRGEKPAPEPDQWGSMFVDGLKLLAVEIIYAAPVILLVLIAFLPLISTFISTGALSQDFTVMSDAQTEQWVMSHPELISALGLLVALILVTVILAIVMSIFSFLGSVRFARTGSISEAFNFSAIISHIRRIGWINYILALLVLGIIGFFFGMIQNLFSLIPVIGNPIGLIIMFILYAPFIVFASRYAVLVYENGEEKTGTLPGSQNPAAPMQ